MTRVRHAWLPSRPARPARPARRGKGHSVVYVLFLETLKPLQRLPPHEQSGSNKGLLSDILPTELQSYATQVCRPRSPLFFAPLFHMWLVHISNKLIVSEVPSPAPIPNAGGSRTADHDGLCIRKAVSGTCAKRKVEVIKNRDVF